jgi:hypothetical protein
MILILLACCVTVAASARQREISDGSPIAVAEKGFTMTPPAGWFVQLDFPGTSLLMLAPEAESQKFQRSIQVMSFNGPVYIDDLGAREFKDVIEKNFANASTQIRDYTVRDPLPVDLESGVSGFLFYSDFKLSGEDVMQMHVLVSSSTRHFVITFTDLKQYFSSSTVDADHLNQAWKTVGSVILESKGPSRLGLPIWIFGSVITLLMGIAFFIKLRNSKVTKTYTAYADDNFVREEDDEHQLIQSPETVNTQQALGSVHEGTNHGDDTDDDEFAFEKQEKQPFKAG